MNSRERIVTALNHQEPDRVPIDFGSLHTSIHRDGHKRLLEHLGLPVYEAPIQDPFQQIVFADEALRKKFGSDVIGIYGNPSMPWTQIDKEVTFWGGGCDATVVMTQGTPDEVRQEAKRRIHDFAPGGGFVFGSIHNIQPNVPPANVVAMFQAAHDFGAYPISV